MISLTEINAVANKLETTVEIIEKDYVANWILFCLSKSNILRENFLLRHFNEAQFIDTIRLFSQQVYSLEDILNEFKILRVAKEKANLILEIDSENIHTATNRVQVFIRYNGYDEILGASKKIKLDFVMGVGLASQAITKKIMARYSDLKMLKTTLTVINIPIEIA